MTAMHKKVLVINTVSFGAGGIRKVIVDYYSSLDKNIYAIDIVATDNKMSIADKEMFLSNNSDIYILKRTNIFSYMSGLIYLCRQKKYDVIHVHGNSATMAIELMAAKICGVKKRIAHCHNTHCIHKNLHRLLYPIFKTSYTYALACSEEAGNWIFGKAGFEVLKNAINLDKYSYSEEIRLSYRHKLGIPNDAFVIGHIGYFNEQKNQEFLIDLLYDLLDRENIIENSFLMLIGVGDKQKFIKDKAEQLNLSGKILFMNAREDVDKLLQTMDLFLFPSKWEGFGLALLEAQLSGLDCIASTNVPVEVNLSGNVNFIPLSERMQWQEKVMDSLECERKGRQERVKEVHDKIKSAGYDIEDAAERLAYIYSIEPEEN